MRAYKRVTLLCGHYGSGKTNIAVNMAFDLRKNCDRVAIADLDIVNPYFRTKDSAKELAAADIRLICSEYANSNVDIPALPQDMYAVTDDKALKCIVDIGGDDRGALALGRLAPAILQENDYEMLMVVNFFRPLTPDAVSTMEVLHEIEQAGGIPFTGFINNSNLGAETRAADIRDSVEQAEAFAKLSGLPLRFTTVKKEFVPELSGEITNLFPLELQKNSIERKIWKG